MTRFKLNISSNNIQQQADITLNAKLWKIIRKDSFFINGIFLKSTFERVHLALLKQVL